MKIYTNINEWKESDNYLISKWFHDLQKKIEKMFEDETLSELEFDYFEFDPSRMNDLYVGHLFFNETDLKIQYKLTILVAYSELEEEGDINLFNIKFNGYDITENELIGTIENSDINTSDFNENYILQLINDFKTEYLEEEKNITDL